MRLFLASEAKNTVTMPKIIEWLGEKRGREIVYIPTAANGEGYGCWRDSATVSSAQELGLRLKICQLEDFKIAPILDVLKHAEILWLMGGMSGYLLYWLYRTRADEIIKKKILEEQVPCIGSSSGAMVLGRSMDVSEHFPGEEERGSGFFPLLGLVDFDIFPHYDEKFLPAIKSFYKGPKLYLLKNGEHITVEENEMRVFGEERVYRPVK